MTPIAIIMMIIAMLVVWGGLAAAIIYLKRHAIEDDPDAQTLGGGAGDQPDGSIAR